MATIRRLTDSCVLVTTDEHASLFDPGFHTFGSGAVDLDSIGDVTRVFITHEHRDHADREFVEWLVDRRADLVIYSNDAVRSLFEPSDVEVNTALPADTSAEDVRHEILPTGAAPPNRSFTIEGLFTHPGDSYQPSRTAPILALPLMAPWGSITQGVEFARSLKPSQVLPVHDFYLSPLGREFVAALAGGVLAEHGIELLDIKWGESFTV